VSLRSVRIKLLMNYDLADNSLEFKRNRKRFSHVSVYNLRRENVNVHVNCV